MIFKLVLFFCLDFDYVGSLVKWRNAAMNRGSGRITLTEQEGPKCSSRAPCHTIPGVSWNDGEDPWVEDPGVGWRRSVGRTPPTEARQERKKVPRFLQGLPPLPCGKGHRFTQLLTSATAQLISWNDGDEPVACSEFKSNLNYSCLLSK